MTTEDITTDRIRIDVADGSTMDGHVFRPAAAGPHPGVLLFQEIFGVNSHIQDVAARIAREGYVVLAPDLFHRIQPGYLGTYDDIMASVNVAMKYTGENSEADVRAAAGALAKLEGVAEGRLGALGFCMGGKLAFVANAVAPLKCAVSYYGGGIATDKLHMVDSLSGPTLFYWAGKDAFIPLEHRRMVADAMTKANKPFVEVFYSEQNHGFFCDARHDYNEAAATQSWALTKAFLKTHLAG